MLCAGVYAQVYIEGLYNEGLPQRAAAANMLCQLFKNADNMQVRLAAVSHSCTLSATLAEAVLLIAPSEPAWALQETVAPWHMLVQVAGSRQGRHLGRQHHASCSRAPAARLYMPLAVRLTSRMVLTLRSHRDRSSPVTCSFYQSIVLISCWISLHGVTDTHPQLLFVHAGIAVS